MPLFFWVENSMQWFRRSMHINGNQVEVLIALTFLAFALHIYIYIGQKQKIYIYIHMISETINNKLYSE